MALPRNEAVTRTVTGLERFEEFLRSLDADDWARPTRCEGWTVANVMAHVVGNLTLIATGRMDEFDDPAHAEREVALRKGQTPGEAADEARDSSKVVADVLQSLDDAAWEGASPIAFGGSLAHAVEAILHDLYVHVQDVNEAVGRPPERDDPALPVVISYIAGELEAQGWGPATLALDGVQEFAVGGGGERIEGDAYDFVMVATGREDPAVLGLDETANIYRPAA